MPSKTLVTRLRDAILSGGLRPGAPLSQVQIAADYGVSRIPVRDALQALAGEGLVVIGANQRARVLSLSPDEVQEIYDLRILLECDILLRAAARLTPDDLADLDRVRGEAEARSAGRDWSDGDWAFHRALYAHAGRPRQLAMIESLRRACRLFISAHETMPRRRRRWLQDHVAILRSLERGDPAAAAEALRDHLRAAGDHLIAVMRKTAREPAMSAAAGPFRSPPPRR